VEGTLVTLDCQHVREVMDSYLSGELSVETNHGFHHHVAGCRDCAGELTRRQRLRALLAATLDVPVDTDSARARIAHAVDRDERSWQRVTRLGAVAATLVAAVVVAYWAGRRVDAAAYDDSAADHVICALTYPEGTVYDRDRAAKNLVSPYEQIVDGIGRSHGVYHVIDAHMCPYKGRNYAHVVIRGDKQTLSIFAERAERGALPEAPKTVLAGDVLDVHATTRLGYRISAVATRDYRLYLVSERPTDPPAVADDILRSAVRFIRGLEK
jgi:anti-sigma factor RsiW